MDEPLLRERICCICAKVFYGYGANPYPVVTDEYAFCCADCDDFVVKRERRRRALN
jgi:hypothetical protein